MLVYQIHPIRNSGLNTSRNFFELFPGDKNDEDIVLNFGRGKTEALWRLGRIPESGAAFANLVERLPDAGWAYIGWADEYWTSFVFLAIFLIAVP
jgi:hypothetical protein